MHTEAEAKKLWCPEARVVSDDDWGRTAANRWPNDDDAGAGTSNLCLASKCSHWRWRGPLPQPFSQQIATKVHYIMRNEGWTWEDVDAKSDGELLRAPNLGRKSLKYMRAPRQARAPAPRQGFCGLSGVPQ